MREKLLDLIKDCPTAQSINSKIGHGKLNNKPIKDIVKESTQFLDSYNPTLSERFYYIYHNIHQVILCQTCQQSKPKFQSLSLGYYQYCSLKCSNNNINKKNKTINTNLERYNTENPMQYNEFKNKQVNTLLKNYNVTSPAKNNSILQKMQSTNLEKYNTKNIMQNVEIKNIIINNKLENEFNRIMKSIEYTPLFDISTYHGVVKQKYEFQCHVCNTIFSYDLNKGRRPKCPVCYPIHISNGEREIREFLLNYTNNIRVNTREVIPPYEIDLFLPDYNLAIEYNGLYYHSEIYSNCDKHYHSNKTLQCLKKKITLFHIFEDEWLKKQHIVKSMILNKINQNSNKIISNNCQIKQVSEIEKSKFLEDHSLEGDCAGDNYVGLYDQERLMSLIVLNKNIIRRFCNHVDYNINSFQLIEYIINELKIKNLIIYVDLRYGFGEIFKKNGFTYCGITEPKEYYLKHGLLERFEEDFIEGNDRIWNCGYVIYEYR